MINLVSGELISTRVIDPTVDTGDLQTKKVEEISLLTLCCHLPLLAPSALYIVYMEIVCYFGFSKRGALFKTAFGFLGSLLQIEIPMDPINYHF